MGGQPLLEWQDPYVHWTDTDTQDVMTVLVWMCGSVIII